MILLLCALLCSSNIEQCQNNTVTISFGPGGGSGVLFTNGDMTFVWTVGHVVDHTRKSNGTFREFTILGGDKQAKAIVLRAGDFDINHDLALLQIIGKHDFHGDSKFYKAFNHVKVGQPIFHVGTPFHPGLERSVFFGYISFVNRFYDRIPVKEGRFVDQVDMSTLGGGSGGGIFDTKTGEILGLCTISNRGFIGFIVPTRYIYEWAKSHDCLWAFDREVPLPQEIVPWRSDYYNRLISERSTSDIDARWGNPIDWSCK